MIETVPLTHNRARQAAIGGIIVAMLLICAAPATARTMLLSVEHLDGAAAIDAAAPRLSWAMTRDRHHAYETDVAELTEQRSLLMRFDLSAIPPNQRIVHAALVVPVRGRSGNEPRLYLWRLLADWGAGVCHLYRSVSGEQEQEKVPWTTPGAAGIASDRAIAPTDVVRLIEDGASQHVINVTEDVEIWYEGRAENHGWIFSVEDPQVTVELASPLWLYAGGWTLRVTYEPQ